MEYHQVSLEQIEQSAGSDMAAMIAFFNEAGFVVDMAPVIRRFPVPLTPVRTFLEKSGWGKN